MRPLPDEDAEQFARGMTEIAWENGAFWRRPDIDRLRAELVATKDELATNADELAAMREQRDELVNALKRIAHQDYRGHPSTDSQIAMNALAAMRKENENA
jgi:hypothetical protein